MFCGPGLQKAIRLPKNPYRQQVKAANLKTLNELMQGRKESKQINKVTENLGRDLNL